MTSWDTPCGIAAHSESLIRSIPWRSAGFNLLPDSESLDPTPAKQKVVWAKYPIVHLNHHDALHSRWTAEDVTWLQTLGTKVVVTYHDTRAEAPPKLVSLCKVADATIVHEPVNGVADGIAWYDLKHHTINAGTARPGSMIYLRQGIPGPAKHLANFWEDYSGNMRLPDGQYVNPGHGVYGKASFKAFPQQPVLGTVGFNFPWKNFDRLAELTGELGWAIVILSNNATAADEERWRARNPHALIIRKYLTEQEILGYLAACDCTAFPYECQNTGTSGAIRLGIGARKPVLAFRHCRQFRDLINEGGVYWCDTWSDLGHALQVDLGAGSSTPWQAPRVADLAHRDRWEVVGRAYEQVYRKVLGL